MKQDWGIIFGPATPEPPKRPNEDLEDAAEEASEGGAYVGIDSDSIVLDGRWYWKDLPALIEILKTLADRAT